MATSVTRKGRIIVLAFDESNGGKHPIENAKIETLSDSNSIDESFTDATGRASISVPPGEYVVSCEAFGTTQTASAPVQPGCDYEVCFELPIGFGITTSVAVADCAPTNDNCTSVTQGRTLRLKAEIPDHLKNSVSLEWRTSAGRLSQFDNDPSQLLLYTDGVNGPINFGAKFTGAVSDSAGRAPNVSVARAIDVWPPVAQKIFGDVGVTKKRTEVQPTDDLGFWSAIRNHSKLMSFGGVGVAGAAPRGYQGFIDAVLCKNEFPKVEFNPGCGPENRWDSVSGVKNMRNLPLHGMSANDLLKTATEIFLLLNCGVAIRPQDPWGNTVTSDDEEISRSGLNVGELSSRLSNYLGSGRLPYIERVVQTAFPGQPLIDSVFCVGVLRHRVDCPCLIELIWSYWHEEAMLAQSLNAISRRFQNMRGPGDRDPLAHLEIDPLRPLNNLLWGYVQDELNRLSVKRRAYEYDHHYGLTLYGKAVPSLRRADSRSKFLEAFHNLLHTASLFYKEDNDTNYIADGFPLLNALKEVHLILAQGAHNQFGDLPWTSRVEMLMQQWLLARPEMRDFLQSRAMVPYTESWMPQVDTMKTLQGWTDVTVTHFHDLGVYGEELLLSIRYGDWIDLNDENHAKNWARYWRPEIQGYLHAYRAVTGVDLANADMVDATMPSVHLQKRLVAQRVH